MVYGKHKYNGTLVMLREGTVNHPSASGPRKGNSYWNMEIVAWTNPPNCSCDLCQWPLPVDGNTTKRNREINTLAPFPSLLPYSWQPAEMQCQRENEPTLIVHSRDDHISGLAGKQISLYTLF